MGKKALKKLLIKILLLTLTNLYPKCFCSLWKKGMSTDSNNLGALSSPRTSLLCWKFFSPEEPWGKEFFVVFNDFLTVAHWQQIWGWLWGCICQFLFHALICHSWSVTRVWRLWAVGICFHFLDMSVGQTKTEPSSAGYEISDAKWVHLLAWLSHLTSNQRPGFLQLPNSDSS